MVINKSYSLFVGVLITGIVAWLIVAKPTKIVEHLILAEASQSVFALIYIAEQRGYFEDERLEVSYKSFSSGRDALNAALSGEADIATTYETPVVHQAMAGKKISVITELHSSTQNTALIARRDKGISTAQDLIGKRIGVSKNTNAEFFLGLFLLSEGLSLSEVVLVDTMPEHMAEKLKIGRVDAVATWNPHLYNAINVLPPEQRVLFSSDVYREVSVLAGTRDVVRDRKEAFKRLLIGLIRAEEYMNSHPKVALNIVIEKLEKQSPEAITNTWERFERKLGLSNRLLNVLESQASWLRRENSDFEGETPDFATILSTDYLEGIAPEDVTVIN